MFHLLLKPSVLCISLEADERDRTLEFDLRDDSGDSIWSSGPVHLKTKQIEESGGFAGFGDVALLLGGGLIAVVFTVFFVYMTTIILSRRKELDALETDYEEDDSEAHTNQTPTTIKRLRKKQFVITMIPHGKMRLMNFLMQ